MAVQNIIDVPKRPRPQQNAQVLRVMSVGQVNEIVRRAKGAYLNELLDAAQDVAQYSDWRDLQITAQAILAAAHQSHPEYFNPTLKGARL